jgi:hypothetical protein
MICAIGAQDNTEGPAAPIGMRHALSEDVAFLERRKGYAEPTVDRRRSYVDIVERVLGATILPETPRQLGRFARTIELAEGTLTAAVTAVEVRVLDTSDEP